MEETLRRALRHVLAGGATEESFRALDTQLRPALFRYFRAHGSSPENAEDLVQKTLARAFQCLGQLRDEEHFLPWLFVIARNVRSTARARQCREDELVAGGLELAEGSHDSRPTAADETVREERLAAVRDAIEKLPPQQRQCVLLRVGEDLSYDEIAQTLRLSVHTVRNHLAQALKSLRRGLKTAWALEGER